MLCFHIVNTQQSPGHPLLSSLSEEKKTAELTYSLSVLDPMFPDRFIHQRLKNEASIRVLILLPSSLPNASIRCKLQEISLESPPSYEALSYVWGAKTGTCPILCDDKVLLVTPNCRDALLQLRGRLAPRTLWIDAICIDQQQDSKVSAQERNQQIKKMGRVYLEARRVIVWLGTTDKATSSLFAQIKSSRLIVMGLVTLLVATLAKTFRHTGLVKTLVSKHRITPGELAYRFYGMGMIPLILK